MLLIKRGLPIDQRDVDSYVLAWQRLLDEEGDAHPHELQRRLFDHLYGNLDVLDGKTNSLIQMTGILVAAYAFSLSLSSLHVPGGLAILFAAGVSYAAIAIFLCLRVIWVHWSSREDLENTKRHIESLIGVRTRRTILFRRAWTFSAMSLASLTGLLLLEAFVVRPMCVTPIVVLLVLVHLVTVFLYDDVMLRLSPQKQSSH